MLFRPSKLDPVEIPYSGSASARDRGRLHPKLHTVVWPSSSLSACSAASSHPALPSVRSIDGRRPLAGRYFNCAGRGRGLYGDPDPDVTAIREALGEFPLAGFFGNGELAPVARRNFFHNYTGALC